MFKRIVSILIVIGLMGGSVFAIKNLGTVQRYTQDFAPFTARDIPDYQAVMDYVDNAGGVDTNLGNSNLTLTGDRTVNYDGNDLTYYGGNTMYGNTNTIDGASQNQVIIGRNNYNVGSYDSAIVGYNNQMTGYSSSYSFVGGSNNELNGSSNSFVYGRNNNLKDNILSSTLGRYNNIESSRYSVSIGGGNSTKEGMSAAVFGYSNIVDMDGTTPDQQIIFGAGNTITGGGNNQLVLGFNGISSGEHSVLISNRTATVESNPQDYSIILDSDNGVGINTDTPTTELDVNGTGKVLNMIVGGGEVANNSFVMGASCIATGAYSFAVGDTNQSLGDYSFTVGKDNVATSNGVILLGENNSDSVGNTQNTIAIGRNNVTNGRDSVVIGEQNTNDGTNNNLVGTFNGSVGGNNNSVFGYGNSVPGFFGDHNVVAGIFNISDGDYNVALGYGIEVTGDASHINVGLGKFNVANSGLDVVIGGGTSPFDKRNAISITGKQIGINNDTPERQLDIKGITRGENVELLGVGDAYKNDFTNASASFAVGQRNVLAGWSTTIGHQNEIYKKTIGNPPATIIVGERNISTGYINFIVGFRNKLESTNNDYSLLSTIGSSNILKGSNNVAIGTQNELSGGGITAIGNGLTGMEDSTIIIGKYNVDAANEAVIFGAGTNGSSRKNAMVITDNGLIGMGIDTPDSHAKLQVNGNIYPVTDGQDLGRSSSTLRRDANLRTVNYVSMYGATNGRFRMPLATSDPAFPSDGMMYYNTNTDKLRLRANGARVDLN